MKFGCQFWIWYFFRFVHLFVLEPAQTIDRSINIDTPDRQICASQWNHRIRSDNWLAILSRYVTIVSKKSLLINEESNKNKNNNNNQNYIIVILHRSSKCDRAREQNWKRIAKKKCAHIFISPAVTIKYTVEKTFNSHAYMQTKGKKAFRLPMMLF